MSIARRNAEMCEDCMGAYSKAILVQGKALPNKSFAAYHQAMLSTSEKMAKKIRTALSETGMTQVALAGKCNVSKQAVQSWLKTGRVDKKHLPTLAQATGKPLAWWLDADEPETAQQALPAHAFTPSTWTAGENVAQYKLSNWPFKSIQPEQYAQLSEIQKAQAEGFIKCLISEANHNKSGTTHKAA